MTHSPARGFLSSPRAGEYRVSAPATAVAAILAFALTAAQARAQVVTWSPGGWSWFGDPWAVHVGGLSGRTFVGWVDWSGNVTIGAYDPRAELLTTDVVGRVFSDDHSAPSIVVEPDQRFTVFWSAHNGSVMNYRDTPGRRHQRADPLQQVHQDIRGSDGFTYPNPVLVPAEHHRLYPFCGGRRPTAAPRGGAIRPSPPTVRTTCGRWYLEPSRMERWGSSGCAGCTTHTPRRTGIAFLR